MRSSIEFCPRWLKSLPPWHVLVLVFSSIVSVLATGRMNAQIATTLTASSGIQATGQGTSQAVVSPWDSSVFTPEPAPKLGQMDAAAAAEIAAFSSTLGAGKSWVGMQASGTITYATDPKQYTATLSILGPMRFRLDTQTPAGMASTRIQGRAGTVRVGSKPVSSIDPDTAILGIFPFAIVGRATSGAKNVALLDRGTVSGASGSLHRVTLEQPSITWNAMTKSQGTLPIDLYFDPVTHLLTKSVCNIFLTGGRHVPVLSVVTYSDYRQVGTSVIPFHYSETLDGQPYRTLQLTSVHLNPSLAADYFQPERLTQ